MTAWFFLICGGVFEVVWAVSLKYLDGFNKITPIIVMLFGMIISFYFLTLSYKSIPIGTAYAVWTGIGATGVAIYGMLVLGDPVNLIRILFLTLIVIGIVGLKFSSNI
ncbi:DMT family transporter [Spirobacillus cienkowskii]|jgi:quaternary ammonium compound-resistance protein SugE|uniref:Guanidinium exporter n=1 Tax=Spirobacillus cienkowskii TaxID=495820 RepID=A0A369KPG1_9BACT|nr:MAG: QacE family quaternary ammonium compound efflux SMR transporter [Spirobacillus cienkowskii]